MHQIIRRKNIQQQTTAQFHRFFSLRPIVCICVEDTIFGIDGSSPR